LGISEITVKAHRGQVMQKMHAESLADLVKISARLSPDCGSIHQVHFRKVLEWASPAA
jgi:type VI protein secretion system component Hcp